MPKKSKADKSVIIGTLAIIFGVLIFLKPDVLPLLVALYLIVFGVAELIK
jgi:uncharacterized membrane protein HdeD (DUF308 family)